MIDNRISLIVLSEDNTLIVVVNPIADFDCTFTVKSIANDG